MSDGLDFRQNPVRIGIVADPQYAARAPNLAMNRHYAESLWKLDQAIGCFNEAPLELVMTLGDVIARDVDSLAASMRVYERLKHPALFVLGNHDFSVKPHQRPAIPGMLGMLAPWYDVSLRGLRFIVLDGNDVSTFAPPAGDPRHEEAAARLAVLQGQGAVQAKAWNGTIGTVQRRWLEDRLALAVAAGEGVILCCHYPIFPEDQHNLWDCDAILDLVLSCDNVLAWFNGHNHAGHYGMVDGRHFVTFRGMADTPDSGAHAIVTIGDGQLHIAGFGREISRDLALPARFR